MGNLNKPILTTHIPNPEELTREYVRGLSNAGNGAIRMAMSSTTTQRLMWMEEFNLIPILTAITSETETISKSAFDGILSFLKSWAERTGIHPYIMSTNGIFKEPGIHNIAKWCKAAGWPLEHFINGVSCDESPPYKSPEWEKAKNKLTKINGFIEGGYYDTTKKEQVNRWNFEITPQKLFPLSGRQKPSRPIRTGFSDMGIPFLSPTAGTEEFAEMWADFFRLFFGKKSSNAVYNLEMFIERSMRYGDDFDFMRPMSQVVKDYCSEYPENFGKFPGGQPEPEPGPGGKYEEIKKQVHEMAAVTMANANAVSSMMHDVIAAIHDLEDSENA